MLKYIWKLTGSEAEACESEDNVSVTSIDDPLSKITGAQVEFSHTGVSKPEIPEPFSRSHWRL